MKRLGLNQGTPQVYFNSKKIKSTGLSRGHTTHMSAIAPIHVKDLAIGTSIVTGTLGPVFTAVLNGFQAVCAKVCQRAFLSRCAALVRISSARGFVRVAYALAGM